MKRFFVLFLVAIFALISCATTQRNTKSNKSRNYSANPNYGQNEIASDISYYKDNSPGVVRNKPYAVLNSRNPAGEAVDGRMMRESDDSKSNGSLWNERSGYNSLFYANEDRRVGDIVYINLKEDLAAMLKKKTPRAPAAAAAPQASEDKVRGSKDKVDKAAAKTAATPAAPKAKVGKPKSSFKNTLIAARIIDRLPNRTLLIEGHKFVEVNRKAREILVSGYINEEDIRNGEVDSSKMADLSIDYLMVNR
jgi:flagellar basal body L-ring protein FlgH